VKLMPRILQIRVTWSSIFVKERPKFRSNCPPPTPLDGPRHRSIPRVSNRTILTLLLACPACTQPTTTAV
jgi:hypothetical protein